MNSVSELSQTTTDLSLGQSKDDDASRSRLLTAQSLRHTLKRRRHRRRRRLHHRRNSDHSTHPAANAEHHLPDAVSGDASTKVAPSSSDASLLPRHQQSTSQQSGACRQRDTVKNVSSDAAGSPSVSRLPYPTRGHDKHDVFSDY
jgi:hypothetical protein